MNKMHAEKLRRLYERFVEIKRDSFLRYAKDKVSREAAEEMYEHYYRPSFFGFLLDVKTVVHGLSVFELVKSGAKDISDVSNLAKALVESGVAHIKNNGEVAFRDKSFSRLLPRPQSEAEIAQKIEKALGVRIQEHAPVTDLMASLVSFQAKPELDQLPVSQSSAVFEVKKIIEYLPLYGSFLFVGDDDFISVFLALADSNVRCIVVDEDEELLSAIALVAKKYRLNITTQRGSVQKKKVVKESVVGFLCNPVYTYRGVKEFLRYGVSHLGKDGGVALMILGDEAIGSRFVLLQRFFAQQNMVMRELAKGAAAYPFQEVCYAEETGVKQRLLHAGISHDAIEKAPVLGASVYIFEYIPYKVKPFRRQQSMYAYL